MQIFEYPYVIITILAMIFIVLGLIGLYFTMKSVKTANGTVEKSFCSIGKIENDFEKARSARNNRCIVYICVSLDSMKRLYAESKAIRMYEQIKSILLSHFCLNIGGEISLYGKENFVAMNSLEAGETEQCIDKCFEEINEVFVEHGAVNVVRVNFGYHCTSSTEVSFKTALGRAKQACSIAENKGVLHCQWDSTNGKEFERKIKIENNIQNEIENNRFFLEYQPILDAKTNKIMGAEVLSRLNSPTEGVLTPYFFLSAVSNVGLNEKFDYYIFEKNCKWISSDKENRVKYVYTINFSRYTLCDKDLAENIINIVEKYGIDYSCIAVEILEDKSLNETEKSTMIANLKRLKEKGVLILLDDFGKGYTSFGDLSDFDISIVKIDKSITQNATNQTGFLILKNIIRTAHDLGFKTLCEGIETEEHKKIAVDAGCDMLQGYYFYRPMPVTRFETLFDK
ncbi:MAG: EAL domain-containing protein [Ruminococcaceae bacterium]|nr:EAL domain-containing protein [Oscillospiraceae bacterium]